MSGLEIRPRSSWDARARRHHPGTLAAAEVLGIALHWPGVETERPFPRDGIARALRGWQNSHMDGRGWSDIAYQVAVDQWGRIWQLRGLENRSAANGGTTVNRRYGAVLLILAQDERPTPAMIAAVRRVIAEHRRLFPRSRRIVGHGDIRPDGSTECPGAVVRRLMCADVFTPSTTNRKDEDDMPTAEEIWNHRIQTNDGTGREGDDTRQASEMLAQAHRRAGEARTIAASVAAELAQVVERLEQLEAGK